jgi:hypothetical protein
MARAHYVKFILAPSASSTIASLPAKESCISSSVASIPSELIRLLFLSSAMTA